VISQSSSSALANYEA